MVQRLVQAKVIGEATTDHLKILFDQLSLSLRDAMAHSAFFADDRERLDRLIAGLSRAIDMVVKDFDASGARAAVFSPQVGSRPLLKRQSNLTTRTRGGGDPEP